jgi:hypothetical protein
LSNPCKLRFKSNIAGIFVTDICRIVGDTSGFKTDGKPVVHSKNAIGVRYRFIVDIRPNHNHATAFRRKGRLPDSEMPDKTKMASFRKAKPRAISDGVFDK